MEQVCDLLGLTLLGTTPPFTEEDRSKATDQSPILDWSGQTTYWEEQLQVTKEGGKHFVKTLKEAFNDVVILEVDWRLGRFYVKRDSLEECESQVSIGLDPNSANLQFLLNPEYRQLAVIQNVFSHVINFQFDWNRRPDRNHYANYQNFSSKFFEAFGDTAVLAERSFGTVKGEFATSDPKSAGFMTRLYEVINACFSGRAAWVDPQGAILRMFDKPSLHSRDLAEWCHLSSDHYLSWAQEDFGSGKTIADLKAL